MDNTTDRVRRRETSLQRVSALSVGLGLAAVAGTGAVAYAASQRTASPQAISGTTRSSAQDQSTQDQSQSTQDQSQSTQDQSQSGQSGQDQSQQTVQQPPTLSRGFGGSGQATTHGS